MIIADEPKTRYENREFHGSTQNPRAKKCLSSRSAPFSSSPFGDCTGELLEIQAVWKAERLRSKSLKHRGQTPHQT